MLRNYLSYTEILAKNGESFLKEAERSNKKCESERPSSPPSPLTLMLHENVVFLSDRCINRNSRATPTYIA